MNDELINKILEDVEFEKGFYEAIAETDDYDVIPIEAYTRDSPSLREEVERKALEAQCERSGLKVLYRISYGHYAVVVSKDGGNRIGIVPETNPDGWPC
jgi:hypothetical protein